MFNSMDEYLGKQTPDLYEFRAVLIQNILSWSVGLGLPPVVIILGR